MPFDAAPRADELRDLALGQGARAGRFGFGPETNPFDVESTAGRTWERARLAVVGDQMTLKLEAEDGRRRRHCC